MEHFPIPDVLECMHFIEATPRGNRRITRNYEFDLYLGGERDIFLDGVPYYISEGDLVFRKPGQLITGHGDFNMYLITLDFSHTVDKSEKLFRISSAPEQPRCNLDILDTIPPVFTPAHFSEMKILYEKISRTFFTNPNDDELQKLYVSELLFLIFADVYKHNRGVLKKKVKTNSYINKACKYIHLNYAENLSVEEIASNLSVNKNHLIKLFKKELNITPNQYIIKTRLIHAREFLSHTDYSVQEVALLCGFNTPSYFSKCFKRQFGALPMEYHKKAQ